MTKIEIELKKLLQETKMPEDQCEIAAKIEDLQAIYKMAKKDAHRYLKIRMIQGMQIYMSTKKIIDQAVRSNHRPAGQSEDGNEAER